jgi:hypothetical protein
MLIGVFAACGRIGFDAADDEGPGAPGAPGSSFSSATAGPCGSSCTCVAFQVCDFSCDEGNCHITCEALSECIYSCDGGGCQITGKGAARVEGTCTQGCDLLCELTADCLQTCDEPSTCTCTGIDC